MRSTWRNSASRSSLFASRSYACRWKRREVLILSRFEFRNYEEIAQLLGCSVGAVKVRVHRAMNQLRETYREMLKETES